jgi:hypothetical protein
MTAVMNTAHAPLLRSLAKMINRRLRQESA